LAEKLQKFLIEFNT